MFPFAFALSGVGVFRLREILKHPVMLIAAAVGYAVLLVIGYRVDCSANARIAAGDTYAIAKRRELLIRNHKYMPEMAEEAIKRVQGTSGGCPNGVVSH